MPVINKMFALELHYQVMGIMTPMVANDVGYAPASLLSYCKGWGAMTVNPQFVRRSHW